MKSLTAQLSTVYFSIKAQSAEKNIVKGYEIVKGAVVCSSINSFNYLPNR